MPLPDGLSADPSHGLSTNAPDSRDPYRHPLRDRRAANQGVGASEALRRLRGAIGRPIAIERDGPALKLVLVDRRRGAEVERRASLTRQRADLRRRLLSHDEGRPARVMRHLVVVHDELGRLGWAGVEMLPAALLATALDQARDLAGAPSTASMRRLIRDLRRCYRIALDREQRRNRLRAASEGPEVTETSHEEFVALEHGWVDTVARRPDGRGTD